MKRAGRFIVTLMSLGVALFFVVGRRAQSPQPLVPDRIPVGAQPPTSAADTRKPNPAYPLQQSRTATEVEALETRSSQPATKGSRSSDRIRQNFASTLPEYGFNQHEVDAATDLIASQFDRTNEVNIVESVENAAKQLELTPERRELLSKAVLKAISDTPITYQQLEACISYRLKDESQCNKAVGEDLLQTVASQVTGDEIDNKTWASLLKHQNAAIDRAARECKTSRERAETLLQLYLTDCP